MHKARVVILGAGFAGLELATSMSAAMGDDVDVTIIDKNNTFLFGFSKLDVMFGRTTYDAVRMPYANFRKPGVRFVCAEITAIDPDRRRITAGEKTYDADFLVVALGAGYDMDATPGLEEAGEFYSFAGAERMRGMLADFCRGKVLIGVCGTPYKCPPAPSECALMLHDYLVRRGIRSACEIGFVLPSNSPVPASPETSQALMAAFAERDIAFFPNRRVVAVDSVRKVAALDDGTAMACDLFLGIPRHRAPDVVCDSGLAVDGWIPACSRTLETRFPGVYAVGDCADIGMPKTGIFAEGAARAVAGAIIAKLRNESDICEYDGIGTCYIEFGGGRIGKLAVNVFSGPKPTGTNHEPSLALRADKEYFGASRRARWFDM